MWGPAGLRTAARGASRPYCSRGQITLLMILSTLCIIGGCTCTPSFSCSTCHLAHCFPSPHAPSPQITMLIILSTLCIIGGCTLLVVFGNQSSETYTVKQLINFYTKWVRGGEHSCEHVST